VKKRGRGFCLVAHPGGTRFGGGDPNQAIVKLKMDGTFELLIGSVDIGQGSSMAMRQIAAEKLEVGVDRIGLVTADTSSSTYCCGTQASRVTYTAGNTVIAACDDFVAEVRKFGAGVFSTAEENIGIDHGYVVVLDDPTKRMSYEEFSRLLFSEGSFVVGHGSYMRRKFRPMDPEGGFFEGAGCVSYGSMVMDIEVDTETGQIDILDLFIAQDVGTPININNCEGQIEGGVVHSIGLSLMENLYPYYPKTAYMPKSFRDYVIPTAKDVPRLKYSIIGRPDAGGPFGAKGFSEGSTHFVAAAIGAAIHDAIGVWITSLPVTPEKVLRALDEKRGALDEKRDSST
jgi:CO/xanthine dehydrogenase Mo-binding subunit